jgi:SAM-dependent methyltransferase
METLKIDYKTNCSELCLLGRKYFTDKSSQPIEPGVAQYLHAYTLFYDGIFSHKRNEALNIAEIGVGVGSSLQMWKDYFPNATLYGFDDEEQVLSKNRELFADTNYVFTRMDVKNADSIQNAFSMTNTTFDIIIEDSTHHPDDIVRVIQTAHQYLKPGGMLIIEDIFKSTAENDYIEAISNVLDQFQDYYFLETDHVYRYSDWWNNDKLFVLVRGDAEPIFKSPHKITIITPSYRTNNLVTLKNSINFDYVNEWIIVHDGSKMSENPNVFANENNSKIKEFIHTGEGYLGNSQRNYALDNITVTDTILYFLDDDNIIHPSLYKLLDIVDKNKVYTFNQSRLSNNVLKGDNITIGNIDTAMMLIDYSLCSSIRWENNRYDADGLYITTCYNQNQDKHIYVDNVLCYYNKLCID